MPSGPLQGRPPLVGQGPEGGAPELQPCDRQAQPRENPQWGVLVEPQRGTRAALQGPARQEQVGAASRRSLEGVLTGCSGMRTLWCGFRT